MTLNTRIESLERSVRRLQGGVIVLIATLIGVGILGASGSQELTLRKLTLVDADGNRRFAMETRPDGSALFGAFDREGEMRLGWRTTQRGAGLALFDGEGKLRFDMETSVDGSSHFAGHDREGKTRLSMAASSDGHAAFRAYDREQRPRLAMETRFAGGAGFIAPDQIDRVLGDGYSEGW